MLTDPLADLLQSTTRERGLTPIPLIATRHDVTIAAGLAVVVTRRDFHNAEPVSIEAVLTFPLPVHATLFDLAAEIDGRRLRAIARARTQARQTYEDALDRGRTAVLHEELLRGVHMLSVAHVPPNGRISVTTKWTMPLAVTGAHASLRIPQSVGEVFGCSPLPETDDLVTGGPPHDVVLAVHAAGGVRVAGAVLADGRARISSAAPIDIVTGLWAPEPILSRDAGGRAVTVTLSPQPPGRETLNVAILVDRSASMAGRAAASSPMSRHQAAREGLKALATALRAGDCIDLWEFDFAPARIGQVGGGRLRLTGIGSAFRSLVRRLREPDGETEIGSAIARVLATSKSADILLLTDGLSHALDVDQLAARALGAGGHDRQAQFGRRISVVLIGKDALEARIGHLAALTGGDVFIVSGEDLEPALAAAAAALRRGAEPPRRIDQLPDSLACVSRNVKIDIAWGTGADGPGDTDLARAAAALAASMIVRSGAPDLAQATALSEGLGTHLTSLVMVDEDGAVQDGLPVFRKVALAADGPEQGGRFMGSMADRLSESAADLYSFPECARRVDFSAPKRISLPALARLIDWRHAPRDLARGHLPTVGGSVLENLNTLVSDSQVSAFAARHGVRAEVVAVALLARSAAGADRHAGRVWRNVARRWTGAARAAFAVLEQEIINWPGADSARETGAADAPAAWPGLQAIGNLTVTANQIDWEQQLQGPAYGDLSHVPLVVMPAVGELMDLSQVTAFCRRHSVTPAIVAIALLARSVSQGNQSACLVWQEISRRFDDDACVDFDRLEQDILAWIHGGAPAHAGTLSRVDLTRA